MKRAADQPLLFFLFGWIILLRAAKLQVCGALRLMSKECPYADRPVILPVSQEDTNKKKRSTARVDLFTINLEIWL